MGGGIRRTNLIYGIREVTHENSIRESGGNARKRYTIHRTSFGRILGWALDFRKRGQGGIAKRSTAKMPGQTVDDRSVYCMGSQGGNFGRSYGKNIMCDPEEK